MTPSRRDIHTHPPPPCKAPQVRGLQARSASPDTGRALSAERDPLSCKGSDVPLWRMDLGGFSVPLSLHLSLPVC